MTNHALDVLNVHKVFLMIWTHGGHNDDHDSHDYVHKWQVVLEGMEEVTAKSSAAGTPWSIGEGDGGGSIWKRGCQGKNIRKWWQRSNHWEPLAIKIRIGNGIIILHLCWSGSCLGTPTPIWPASKSYTLLLWPQGLLRKHNPTTYSSSFYPGWGCCHIVFILVT